MENLANRECLELLEKSREGLDAAMPAGRGAGADGNGELLDVEGRCAKCLLSCFPLSLSVEYPPCTGSTNSIHNEFFRQTVILHLELTPPEFDPIFPY